MSQETKEYEIEVRAFIPEVDFGTVLNNLTYKFGKPTITELKTFLFRSSNGYGRIRIKKDANMAVLTKKIGGLDDKARVEINKEILLDEVDSVIFELNQNGLKDCSYLKSISYSFHGPKKQMIFLSRHSNLGDFLEVENITENKNEIDELYQEVKTTLEDLSLQELSAVRYQDMMNVMYANTLKPVELYRSEISAF